MKVLLVGTCLFNRSREILNAKGYETHLTYMANPVTLLSADRIPDGLEEQITRLGITDRLERRTLACQFEGISAERNYDVIFVSYYQELRTLLRHKREKYFLHLNFRAIKAFEPPATWEWVLQNFDIVDTEPEKYIQRLTGLLFKIRKNFPTSSIIVVNKFPPVKALGPNAEWICTDGRPFDAPYLDKMEKWFNAIIAKDSGIYLFHTENIMIDFLNNAGCNFQFLYPEISSPSSNCTLDNYIRVLEHPSKLYYQKFSEYAEKIFLAHNTGDKDELRRLCRIKDRVLWERFTEMPFSLKPMTMAELFHLIQDRHLTSQMVGLENSLLFDPEQLKDIDRIFINNLQDSQLFLELGNNFRTVFRIRPRKSLLPALELFHGFFKDLNRQKNGKNYYLINVRDFEDMSRACRETLPAHF